MPLAALFLAAAPVETIRYSMGPCLGSCPAYTVTVSSEGRGLFEGRSYTAVKGRRSFRATPAQVAAFAARLRPVRPTGEVLVEPGQPLCRSYATDQISVDVRWSGGAGDPRHLRLYFGCAMDEGGHADVRHALAAAPDALPIGRFIGRH